MVKEYRVSRLILAVIAFIGSCIAVHNEDISVQVIAVGMFVVTAVFVSFLGTIVSRKMIEVGDKIESVMFRVLYYIALLFGILFVTYLALILMMVSSDWVDDLGTAVFYFLLECCVFIFLIVPYIQTLIVLVLRKILKDNETA